MEEARDNPPEMNTDGHVLQMSEKTQNGNGRLVVHSLPSWLTARDTLQADLTN